MARRRSIKEMIGVGETNRVEAGGGGLDVGAIAAAYGGGKKGPPKKAPKRPRRPAPDQRGSLIGKNNTNGPAAPVPGQKVPTAPTQKITGRGVGASPQPQAPVTPKPTPAPRAPVSPRATLIGGGATNGPAAPVPGQKVPAAPTQTITGRGVGASPQPVAPATPIDMLNQRGGGRVPPHLANMMAGVPGGNARPAGPTPKPVANLPPQIQAFNAAQGKAAGIIDSVYPKKRPRRPKPLPIAF